MYMALNVRLGMGEVLNPCSQCCMEVLNCNVQLNVSDTYSKSKIFNLILTVAVTLVFQSTYMAMHLIKNTEKLCHKSGQESMKVLLKR